jgi:hypothetical protein
VIVTVTRPSVECVGACAHLGSWLASARLGEASRQRTIDQFAEVLLVHLARRLESEE